MKIEPLEKLYTVAAKKAVMFSFPSALSILYIIAVPFPFHVHMHTIGNNGRGFS